MTDARVWRRRSLAAFIVLVLALVIALAVRPTRRTIVEEARPAAPPTREEPPERGPLPSFGVPVAGRPGSATPPIDRIQIDEVAVDKQRVCKGEQIVVTVKARSLDGEDDDLTYGVMGRSTIVGPRFALRLDEPLGLGWMQVFVRGKRGTIAVADVPPVGVDDCPATPQVEIDLRRSGAMPDRAWLTASVSSAEPFEAAVYEWDFGDGAVEKGQPAAVEHAYESRLQNRPHSYFFVTVRATDARGRTAEGSRSIRFVNLGYRPLVNEGRVRVFAGIRSEPKPGAPHAERIWLYHGAPEVVTLERVTVRDVVLDADGRERTAATRVYGVVELLGVSEVPPGKSVAIKDLGHLRPEAGTRRIVEIAGSTRGARTAEAAFTLIPPTSPIALDTEGTGQPAAKERQP